MSTAGYSATPLWKKLGFKPGMKVALIDAPAHYPSLISDKPASIAFSKTVMGSDAIHLFIRDAKGLAEIPKLARHLPPAIMLWVSWPKLSSAFSQGCERTISASRRWTRASSTSRSAPSTRTGRV